MNIRDRILRFDRITASQLTPNPKNWRIHPDNQAAALTDILADVGWANAVLARQLSDGKLQLIDGHLRTELASDAEIPVLVLDVTEAETVMMVYLPKTRSTHRRNE